MLFLLAIPRICLLVQADLGRPPIQRVFKKKEIDRYLVVIDTNDPAGKTHIEFELRMSAEHPITDSSDTSVRATFQNLRETIDGRIAPSNKVFGVATYRFPKSGFPVDFTFAKGTPFMIPILSWYTPSEALSSNLSFKVPEMVFDDLVHVSGQGGYKDVDSHEGSVQLDLTFAASEQAQQYCVGGSVFHSIATFSLNSGVLLKSEGDLKRPDGITLTFRTKKV